jgi:hypothetical protein
MSKSNVRLCSVAATLAVSAMAAGLLAAQGYYLKHTPDLALPATNRRVALLRQATDPVKRDALCIPMSAYGRKLDRALDPQARVFVSGMLGKTNLSRMGYYCFLRNQLFPREVQISLDGKPVFRGGWYDGIPCDSAEELQARGYDLLMRPGTNDSVELISLSRRGRAR